MAKMWDLEFAERTERVLKCLKPHCGYGSVTLVLGFWLRKAWRSLSRLRLGVTLLVLLLGAVAVGTLFPQVPQQTDNGAWWQAVRDRYGFLYHPLRALGVFDLFGAWWYQGMLGLLLLSTLACLLRRVWPLTRVVARPRTRLPTERFERAASRAKIHFPSIHTAEDTLRAALRQRHYRVQAEMPLTSEGTTAHRLHLRADRHRLPRLGTLFTHLGLVALLLGAAWSELRGWRSPDLAVTADAVTSVGHGTGVGLRCDRFTLLRYEDGAARDYRADVTLFADDERTLRVGTIAPNHPLHYGGVAYYLQGYRLNDASGRNAGEAASCSVTLQGVRDPGYGLVVAGAVCLLVGVTLTFHFPHRRVWARVDSDGQVSLVGSTSWDIDRFNQQFDELASELRGAALEAAARGETAQH